jgi:transposase
LKAHLAFLDESGFLLIPNVRRTWAPRGETPIVRHRYNHARISAISAVTVSPERRRLGLYMHLHHDNITQQEVAEFLREMLRHLRGHLIVLLDGGSIHRGGAVRELLGRAPRLHIERFPAYAPELNPDERVWAHMKNELANGRPDNAQELLDALCQLARKTRVSQALLRGFVNGSDLPRFLRP